MRKLEVVVPFPWRLHKRIWVRAKQRKWTITEPLLKLVLKYGIADPFKSPFNASHEFDSYTKSRGPNAGLPSRIDLLVTRAMGSRVTQRNIRYVEDWLKEPHNFGLINRLRNALCNHAGLEELPQLSIDLLAEVIQALDTISYIGEAKAFKWLATWAPAHVPMIDGQLNIALREIDPDSAATCRDRITLFQRILKNNLSVLQALGIRLGELLGFGDFAISPTRVLDNLLWFDWYLVYDKKFAPFIKPADAGPHHEIRARGREYAQQFC
jgi:hypothetical protein